eukprot:TRINITY_DN28276_c0_g1_i1.p1 TRINITY_DN28276_c0_g1~~TRINITY_DN28276_c0_g1_i1.p1  ORF type:complete len:266 (-),score=54.21 TRINITY_DN28276_c0_g1_i1:93-827(-)
MASMSLLSTVLMCGLSMSALATEVPSWACAVKKRCPVSAPLQAKGVVGKVALHSFQGATASMDCPFGPDGDDKPLTEKQKAQNSNFLKGLGDAADLLGVTDVSAAERAAAAKAVVTATNVHEGALAKADSAKSPKSMISVDAQSLRELVQEADVLVTFYAPWCPHCQAFLINEGAPLKGIAEEFSQMPGAPKVAVFDTAAHAVPSDLNVEFIPTVYLMKKNGDRIEFTKDPLEIAALKSFALGK